ncbi:MAG TPA: TolC family protein [Polyangiaceae bacterium]
MLLALVVLAATPAAADDVIPGATELPQTLTLDEALRIFKTTGLDLLIADANVRNAEGALRIAGAIPNPVFSASVGNAFTYNAGGSADCAVTTGSVSCSPWIYEIGLNDNAAISDSVSGKRYLRTKVARTALAAAKMNRADAERTITLQVKTAYAQVARAELGLKFAKEVAQSNGTTLKKFQDRYKAGAIQEGDLMRIETQKLESDQALDSAQGALDDARYALAFLLGVRGRVNAFDVDEKTLDYAVPLALRDATVTGLLRSAFDHRPDLIAIGYQRASAEAQIALARRQRVPDLNFGINYAWGGYGGTGTNGPLQTPTITFGISLALPLFYQQQGEVKQAQAAYDTTSLEHARATAQVVNDVSTAYSDFATAKRLVERMEGPRREGGGLLESAKGAFERIALMYEKSAISLTDYLDALRAHIATRAEYFNDLANYWSSIYALEAAVGVDLRK